MWLKRSEVYTLYIIALLLLLPQNYLIYSSSTCIGSVYTFRLFHLLYSHCLPLSILLLTNAAPGTFCSILYILFEASLTSNE